MKQSKESLSIPSYVVVFRNTTDHNCNFNDDLSSENDDIMKSNEKTATTITRKHHGALLLIPSIIPISLTVFVIGLLVSFYSVIITMKHHEKQNTQLPMIMSSSRLKWSNDVQSLKYNLRQSHHSKNDNNNNENYIRSIIMDYENEYDHDLNEKINPLYLHGKHFEITKFIFQ